MNVVPTIDRLLDASSYLEWALDNPEERTELVDGKIVWMSPETNLHSEVKVAVGSAFYAAARRTEPRCRVFSDGSGVKVGEGSVFVPDIVVQQGPVDGRALTLDEPIIVVEIISPASRGIDTNRKLHGYFRVPSIVHYLVIDPVDRTVIHFRRHADGAIHSEIVTAAAISLDPPGMEIAVADLFPPGA